MPASLRTLVAAAAVGALLAVASHSTLARAEIAWTAGPAAVELSDACEDGPALRAIDARYAALAPDKQTKLGLYISADDARRLKLERGDALLLIDVRSHAEREMSGVAPESDAHVAFGAEESPARSDSAFVDAVARVVAERGGSRDDDIVLLSEDGTASAKAADALAGAGYSRVYSVVDGFDGEAQVDGRTHYGWSGATPPRQAPPIAAAPPR